MRLLRVFLGLALLLTYSACVLAQVSAIPTCGKLCLFKALQTQSECPVTDQACICQNKRIAANVTACVAASCTRREALTYANISKTTCGVEKEDRTALPIYPAAVLLVCTTVIVWMRMWARKISAGFWWDDWVIFATWVVLVPFSILGIFMGVKGLGKHVWDIPFNDLTQIMKIYYFDESLYLVISAGYKIGILLFLLRIFPAKGFRTITYGVIGFNVAWGIASVFMTIFQCIPLRKAWDWEHIVPGRCNNIHVQAWTAAAMGIFLDLVILILPIPELLKLQLNTKKKLGLLAMFSVGIFITIASIIRLQTLVHFSNSHDPTWDNIPATYWTAIEMNVGVSCACMPALRPLLKGAFPKLGTLFSSSKGATGNTSNSSGTIERIKQRQGALRMEEGSAGHSYRSDGTIDTKSDTTVVELSHMDTRTGAHSDMHDVSWDADSSRGIVDRKENVF